VTTDPVIIEAAINGVTTKAVNPNVPRSPAEITADALACFDAGAAIVHNHVDLVGVPGAEAADRYLEAWRPLLDARPDALVYPTVNVDRRGELAYDHIEHLAASGIVRLSLCDPGSLNLGAAVDGVPTGGFVYRNSFDEIAEQLRISHEHGLGPSMAIYEPGFLRTAIAWWRAGRLPAGAMFKLYFSTDRGYMGAPFGLPPTERALDAYLEVLGGCPVPWAASVVGGDVVATGMARLAIERGGHIHLGLEFYAGDHTPTNAELVSAAVKVCADVGVRPATPDEAVAILGLPGR
jgi:3-keto-5-aminohexanoate cleavage enzyme